MEGSAVISITIAAVEGRETYQDASTRKCAWSRGGVRCPAPAELRRGTRGPLPRWCAAHRAERKKYQDNGHSRPRTSYRMCCGDWQESGHRGLCPQCRQNRDESRPTATTDRPGVPARATRRLSWRRCSPLPAAFTSNGPRPDSVPFEARSRGGRSHRMGTWHGRFSTKTRSRTLKRPNGTGLTPAGAHPNSLGNR